MPGRPYLNLSGKHVAPCHPQSLSIQYPLSHPFPKQLSSPCCASAGAGLLLVVRLPSPPTHTGPAAPNSMGRRHQAIRIPANALCTTFLLFRSAHIPCLFQQGALIHTSVLLHKPCPDTGPPSSAYPLLSLVNSRAPVPSSRAGPSGMPSLGASTSSTLGATSFPASPNQKSMPV